MVNWYLTKEARIYNGIKIVSLTNDVGSTGLVLAKKEKEKKETRPPAYTIH